MAIGSMNWPLAHHRTGDNIFIFDYRGYDDSEGKPSEKGTYLDSRAALEYLLARPDVDQDRVIYQGHSLGAAVAVELALTQPPMAMVLVSSFASVLDMASLTLPFPPGGWLVRNHFNNLSRIGGDKLSPSGAPWRTGRHYTHISGPQTL